MTRPLRSLLPLLLLLTATEASAADEFTVPAPYFGGQAAQDFAAGKWAAARAGFAPLLAGAHDAETKARLGLLIGLSDARLGRPAQAAPQLDEVAAALPLIADHVHYEAARAWFAAGDLDKARARAERVAPDAVLAAEARLIVGDVLRGQGKWREAADLYERYLEDGRVRVAEARFHLATAYERLKSPAAKTLALYRQITIEAPLEAWAARSQARLADLMKALPAARRRALTTLTAEELVTRGKVYFDAMRNELSEADYSAALAASGANKELACVAAYHRAESVFKQRQRARAAPLFDQASKLCAPTANEDLKVRSAYQGGRAYANSGDLVKAVARFAAAEEGHPTHSYADDARLRQAEAWQGREPEPGAAEQVVMLLRSIPERYPDGDMKAEALWRLGWRDFRAGDDAGAIGWLRKAIELVPHDERFYAEGQAWYWIGRARTRLRDTAGARAAYGRVAREYPLSYYALLALNRLREEAPEDFTRLVGELQRPPAAWRKGTPVFRASALPVFREPGYLRAVELLRLGLGSSAERELSRVGLRVPEGRKKVTAPEQLEQLWATALLYDRAHSYDKSHWIARWSALDYKQAWPTEANRIKWEIAYPRAWWHILEPAAQAQGYPPELLISFVREESGFSPAMESFANAIGLTQMILPTANRFGSGLGFPITRETLRDPEKNVAVGSRWLAFLWQTFEKNPALLVPAYNAGEGAVWKWLCLRGDWPLDEFAEQIPYDETRNYSKRVLSSYFTWSYLRDGTVPVLPNTISPSVINTKRCPTAAAAPAEGAEKPDKTPREGAKGVVKRAPGVQ